MVQGRLRPGAGDGGACSPRDRSRPAPLPQVVEGLGCIRFCFKGLTEEDLGLGTVGLKVMGSRFRVEGIGYRVQGIEYWV